MPAGPLTSRSILNCMPAHITEIAHPHVTAGLHHHQNPFIQRIDQHHALAVFPLGYGLSNPCRWPFFLALVDDGTEWRVYIVRSAPLARQAIEPDRERVWAWIKIEMKFLIEARVKVGRGQPIMQAVRTVSDMKFICNWRQFGLMHLSFHFSLHNFVFLADKIDEVLFVVPE